MMFSTTCNLLILTFAVSRIVDGQKALNRKQCKFAEGGFAPVRMLCALCGPQNFLPDWPGTKLLRKKGTVTEGIFAGRSEPTRV